MSNADVLEVKTPSGYYEAHYWFWCDPEGACDVEIEAVFRPNSKRDITNKLSNDEFDLIKELIYTYELETLGDRAHNYYDDDE